MLQSGPPSFSYRLPLALSSIGSGLHSLNKCESLDGRVYQGVLARFGRYVVRVRVLGLEPASIGFAITAAGC